MIELKNSNYFWQYQYTCQLIHTVLDVIIVRYSYIFELNHSMSIFLDCASIAFSEQYEWLDNGKQRTVSVIK